VIRYIFAMGSSVGVAATNSNNSNLSEERTFIDPHLAERRLRLVFSPCELDPLNAIVYILGQLH
jgi:hypothetical protein